MMGRNEWDRGWRDGFFGWLFDKDTPKPAVFTYALGFARGERDRKISQ